MGNKGGEKVVILLTAPSKEEIIIKSTVKDNNDGTYTCEYLSPEKRGSYELHIKINNDDMKGSPFPIFFCNDLCNVTMTSEKENISDTIYTVDGVNYKKRSFETDEKIELAECARLAVHTALSHIDGYSCTTSTGKLQLAVQTAVDKAKAQSAIIKVFNISPIITINMLHELFSLYGRNKLIEFKKEGDICTALIKFDSILEANKSTKASGLKVGDRILRIEKWVDPYVVKNIHLHQPFKRELSQNLEVLSL